VTSRCIAVASFCDLLTAPSAWLSAFWKPTSGAAPAPFASGTPSVPRPARATAWAKSKGFSVTFLAG
jgi:hypothetical protein